MKYPIIQCDLCGMESYSDEMWTTINLGIKIIGSPAYEDICQQCSLWIIETFDKKRLNK